MAKSTAKRPPKSIGKSAYITPSKSSGPPTPYSTPPPVLRPLLETLNPEHVYITHVDSHPKALKQRIFMVPVLMNIVIACLLLWRAQVALPNYGRLILVILGYENELKVNTEQAHWTTLLDVLVGRTFMLFIDFTLAKFVLPWPMDFFAGSPGNPVKWRWSVGFQDVEIVVRRSRRWDQTLRTGWLTEGPEGAVYKERILPAIDKEWVRTKTSYTMMDKNWDLDFAGMVTAHELVKQGKASLQDFQKTVIVYTEDNGWVIWPVWTLEQGSSEQERKLFRIFNDELRASRKEVA